MTSKKSLRLAIIIGLVFFVERMIYLNQLGRSPLLDLLFLDSDFYFQWARSLFYGQGHPHGPFWLSPGYPLAMAGLFKSIGSESATLVVVAQSVLSLGTLLLLGLIVRNLFGETVAFVSCGMAALYAPWLYYDGVILSATLILFLNALALWLILRDDATVWWWLLIGLIFGFSALARPAILIFTASLVVYMLVRNSEQKWLRSGLMIAAIAVVLIPVLVRNYQVSGSLVLTTSSGGINFFIGNRTGASGVYDELDFVQSFDPQREAEGYRAEASRAAGKNLSLNEASRFWFKQAVRDIVEVPFAWIGLLLKKVWLTVQNEEIANNISFRGVNGFVPVTGAMPLRWGLLFPFAFAGAFLLWWKRREERKSTDTEELDNRDSYWVLGLYAVSYLLVNLIFFSSSEYRFPMILVMLPLAGYFFVGLWSLIQIKDYRSVVFSCVVYLGMLVISNFPSREVTLITKPRADYYNMAMISVDRKEITESIPLFARSLIVDDTFRLARIGLAQALWALGNFDDARQEFEQAGVSAPDTVSGTPLNEFLHNVNVYTEDDNALGALDYIQQSFPDSLDAPLDIWTHRATIELSLGMTEEALRHMLKAHHKDPTAPEWLYLAGRYAEKLKRPALADSLYQESIERMPAFAPSRIALGYLALARDDEDAAIRQLSELEKIRIPEDSVVMQMESFSGAIDLYHKNHSQKGNEKPK